MSEREYTQLFKDFHLTLVGFAHKFLRSNQWVEDVVADAFVKLIKYKDDLDVASAKNWLFTVVANKSKNILKHLKRRNNKQKEIIHLLEDCEDNDPFLFESLKIQAALLAKIVEEIKILPPLRRKIITLYLNYDAPEISQILNISQNTVRAELFRFKQSFGTYIPKPTIEDEFIFYNGETKTVEEWSTITNIPVSVIQGRIKDHWKAKDILSTPVHNKRKNEGAVTKHRKKMKLTVSNICYNGITKSLDEWSATLKISRTLLFKRIFKYHWSVKTAFTTPAQIGTNRFNKSVITNA